MRVLVSFLCIQICNRKKLNMLIEGRIGTRVGSEHYGQYDKTIRESLTGVIYSCYFLYKSLESLDFTRKNYEISFIRIYHANSV